MGLKIECGVVEILDDIIFGPQNMENLKEKFLMIYMRDGIANLSRVKRGQR